jgi:hypothetical protein
MFVVSVIGGLVLLALVLYEVQNAVKAVIFALEWPSELRVTRTDAGYLSSKEGPLSKKTRAVMALYRLAYDSLLLHEVHSFRMKQPPLFKTIPSFAFGGIVMTGAYLVGLPVGLAVNFGLCATAVLFSSGQAKSFSKFYARRAQDNEQLMALYKGMQS